MPTQKKVIIGTRKNLVEATVHNRSEVVEYLKQHDWHLDRETFIRVAPDEYCLVSKSALTPDMDIVDEEVVHTWSTADTAQSEELRAYKARLYQVCRLFQLEIMLIGLVTIFAALIAWKSFGMTQGIIAGVTGILFMLLKLTAFAATGD